ncbi:MAG: hypothetical protein H7070_00605 [Saprospiraceae bacterium]|nr:hypothetical protein [Pyrinomonadaceae bacterium]
MIILRGMLSSLTAIAILFLLAADGSAQFNIKLPKIPKVEKTAEETKTDVSQPPADVTSSQTRAASNSTKQSSDKPYGMVEWPDRPQMVWDTLYIQTENSRNYWKMQNQKPTSWVPKIRFSMDYNPDKFSPDYVAEYFNPDGSLWFSEHLRNAGSGALKQIGFESNSEVTNEMRDTRSTIATGVYGFKLSEKNTKQTLFQGKFRIGKFPLPGNDKNVVEFFVDHDWVMPVGFISFHFSEFLRPNALGGFPLEFNMWFKKYLAPNNHGMEAQLFYNGKQIGTTADYHSGFQPEEERSSSQGHIYSPDLHNWRLWKMIWQNVIVDNNGTYNREVRNRSFLIDKNPGEYTVKVFQKGGQIREAKFTVGSDGRIADPFSKQAYLTYHKVIVPITVIGPAEKYNVNAWKTEAFYGNPLTGFAMP